MFFLRRLIQRFKDFKEPVANEALLAYIHKLPNRIKVEWFRDGQFIIGKVSTDDFNFVTQGIGAQDFIKMVDESVMVASNIPPRYIHKLMEHRVYAPDANELRKLNDLNVKSAQIGVLLQDEKEFKFA